MNGPNSTLINRNMQSDKNTKITMHQLNALVQADWQHAAQGDKHSHGPCSSDKTNRFASSALFMIIIFSVKINIYQKSVLLKHRNLLRHFLTLMNKSSQSPDQGCALSTSRKVISNIYLHVYLYLYLTNSISVTGPLYASSNNINISLFINFWVLTFRCKKCNIMALSREALRIQLKAKSLNNYKCRSEVYENRVQ